VEIAKSKPYDVDYLPGAAILCRLSVWDLVGGMPEKYYFAYEEAEFALRIRKQKFRIIVLPEARILHKVGMSSDKQPMYIYNDIRNRLKFGRFLWGKLPGFLLAAFWNLIGLRNTSYGLALWSRAVFDEIRGVALNLATLLEVKRDFTQPM
jgi:GT2 family glycosyltransferase